MRVEELEVGKAICRVLAQAMGLASLDDPVRCKDKYCPHVCHGDHLSTNRSATAVPFRARLSYFS